MSTKTFVNCTRPDGSDGAWLIHCVAQRLSPPSGFLQTGRIGSLQAGANTSLVVVTNRMFHRILTWSRLMSDRRCPYCQQIFPPALYHPQQLVCSRPECQQQRRRNYHRHHVASDSLYRQVCRESAHKWREDHPGYWKRYRQQHPEQVERNRRRQQRRDQKRRLLNLANNNLAVDLKRSAAEVWLFGPTARHLLRNTHSVTGTTLRPRARAWARSLASARNRQSFSCLA